MFTFRQCSISFCLLAGERDFIGLDQDGRLLFFAAEADLEEDIVLRKSLLARFVKVLYLPYMRLINTCFQGIPTSLFVRCLLMLIFI